MQCLKTCSFGCIALTLLAVLLYGDVTAAVNQNIIDDIDKQLDEVQTTEERGRLYMFKARNYARGGDYEKALESYDRAIRLNHRGWVHLERANFFLLHKKYALAETEAFAAKEETSTLASQADPIIHKAEKELEKIYLTENPPVIIFDTEANSSRKSRFDYMRQIDVSAAMKKYSKKLDKQRTVAAKKSSSSSKSRKRRT